MKQAFRGYYRYLDSEIGSLIEGLGDDDALLVVSDHGAQAMFGGIQVNEWLIQEGYLTLVEPPDRADADRPLPDRLVAHQGVGGRRLLLADLPERGRARAAGRRAAGRVRGRCATS